VGVHVPLLPSKPSNSSPKCYSVHPSHSRSTWVEHLPKALAARQAPRTPTMESDSFLSRREMLFGVTPDHS